MLLPLRKRKNSQYFPIRRQNIKNKSPFNASKINGWIIPSINSFMGLARMNAWNAWIWQLKFQPQDKFRTKDLPLILWKLHSVQHITIVSIKSLHLLVVIFGFLNEVQQLLSVPSCGEGLSTKCFRFIPYLVGLGDCFEKLLGLVFDVELSCHALCFPIFIFSA